VGNGTLTFIHTADWHLGMSYHSRRDEQGVPVEFAWTRTAAKQLAEFAEKRRVPLVLMSGDILHRGNPSPTVENILAEILRTLTRNGATVVYLLGNHEVPSWGDHPARIYNTLDVEGVIVADSVAVHRVDTPSGIVQVAAMPYPAVEKSSFAMALERLLPALDSELPAILMSHIYLDGAKLSGTDLQLLPDEPHIDAAALHRLPFDYIALGHIHRHQAIGANPPAVYCGSIQRVSFAEEKERKGFVFGQIAFAGAPRTVKWQFVPIEATKFITADIDIRGEANAAERIERALLSNSVQDAVLRIRILRGGNDPAVNLGTIRKRAYELGAAIVRIEEAKEMVARARKSDAQTATGDIIADIERYIRAERPDIVDSMPAIAREVRRMIK